MAFFLSSWKELIKHEGGRQRELDCDSFWIEPIKPISFLNWCNHRLWLGPERRSCLGHNTNASSLCLFTSSLCNFATLICLNVICRVCVKNAYSSGQLMKTQLNYLQSSNCIFRSHCEYAYFSRQSSGNTLSITIYV